MPLAVPAGASMPVLRVVKCRTSDAGGVAQGSPPPSIHADVPAGLAGRISAYYVESDFFVLGPAQAACSADVGANGSSRVAIRRSGNKQAVVSFSSTYSYGDVTLWACVVDTAAARLVRSDLGLPCPRSPAGERITKARPGVASFTEAPRMRDGLPHETSAYRTVGAFRWDLSTDGTYAEVRACALPPAEAALCAALLAGNVRQAEAEGWATAEVGLADSAPAGQQPPEGDIAVDASGADHVVFATADGVGYRTNAGGAWITTAAWPGFAAPRIAIAPGGGVVIAMVSSADGAVYVARGSGGSLGAPEPAFPSGAVVATRVALAVDGRGDVFVAATPATAGSPSTLAVLASNGTWSAPIPIASDVGALALAGVPSGGARLAYLRSGRARVATAAADGTVSAEQALPKGFGTDLLAIAVGPDGRAVVAGIAGSKVAVEQERAGKWVLSQVDEAISKLGATSLAVAVDPKTRKAVVLWDGRGGDVSFRLSRGPGGAADYSWPEQAWLTPDSALGPGRSALAVTADGSLHILVPVSASGGKSVIFEVATRGAKSL